MNQKVKMKPSYLKIAFLDRDGTLIKDYPDEKWREIKEPEFLEGSIEGLKRLKEMGYDFIIITNQYLINDGIISLNDYQQFTGKFLKKLKEENIDIVVYGHSHKSNIYEEKGILYINPGSVGPRRFNLPISMAKLKILDNERYYDSLKLIDKNIYRYKCYEVEFIPIVI